MGNTKRPHGHRGSWEVRSLKPIVAVNSVQLSQTAEQHSHFWLAAVMKDFEALRLITLLKTLWKNTPNDNTNSAH